MIRLIATDMDGTLLTPENTLPEGFSETLRALKRQGITFVVASGRSLTALEKNFRGIPEVTNLICENGALTILEDRLLSVAYVPHETVCKVVDALSGIPDLAVMLCCKNGTYHEPYSQVFTETTARYYVNQVTVPDLKAVKEDCYKLTVLDFRGGVERTAPLLREKLADELTLFVTGTYWTDIMDKGVNKGSALKVFQEKLGITPEQTMVFGDYYNDVPLFEQAFFSYAMANAPADMGKRARFTAPSNAENGVLRTIWEKVLGREETAG